MFKFLKSIWEDTWEKVVRTFWVFFRYLLSQVGIQVMNMATGFLIIRALTKDDYANYTIINTLVPVMLLLCDSGLGTGVSAIGRHIWQDDEKMGQLINTGLQIRRKFVAASFLLIGPLLVWMLFRNHASVTTIVLLTGVALTGVSFQLTGAVMKLIMLLRQHVKILGNVGLVMTLLRLCLVVGFIVFFHLDAVLAMLAGTCAVIVETYYLTRAARHEIHWDAPPDPEYRATIFSYVKKTMPLTLYFAVQGQISIWLISIFGSTHQVADIGAAGRLGVIFTTMASPYFAIIVPRFARNNGRRRLFIQFFQTAGSLLLLILLAVAFTKFFPAPFIMLLGAKYANMSGLIWLIVLSSGLGALANVIFSLNMSKGWIPPAIMTIPVEIITQIILVMTLDLSKTESVLIFACLSALPPTVLNIVILIRGIRREAD